MLVKKKNPSWFPSENKQLKVGETIEMTDPKQLIVNGDVVGVGEAGEELGAYELYGVLIADEVKEFEEYIKMKKQEALKDKLEKEKAELEAQLTEKKPVEAPEPAMVPDVSKTATEVNKEAKKK